jgi:riboflavin synthase
MFTGLIGGLGSVAAVERNGAGATLEIRTTLASELGQGDSIAVNGVCLTATDIDDQGFRAEAMTETLRRSSLGELTEGSTVNLELPLRAGERLGGHIVQGHVDGTGTVRAIREEGFARVLEIETDPSLERYLVEKGSVALDGVSLTVSALLEHGFAVSLIPETLKRTNLGGIGEGAQLNIEVDILAKQVERLMEARA